MVADPTAETGAAGKKRAADPTADPESGAAGYKAAGVIFYTQEDGQVRNVLLAMEERKVSAKQLGIEVESGMEGKDKINTDVVVFPQGRRERKDEGDPVETAMREYHEETGNFGALTQHLLRFYEDDADDEQGITSQGKSFIFYFNNARMVVVFCEVPIASYKRTLRTLKKDDFDVPKLPVVEEPATGSTAGVVSDKPAKKKAKKDPTASFTVGKENHLTPVWVSADALKAAVTSLDTRTDGTRGVNIDVTVCARQSVDGTGNIGVSGVGAGGQGAVERSVPFFPLNLSVFRQREARIWLGLPVSLPVAEDSVASKGAAAPAKADGKDSSTKDETTPRSNGKKKKSKVVKVKGKSQAEPVGSSSKAAASSKTA